MSVRKDGKVIAGTTVNPDLFDFKWADHILDDISWVRADTFSWQSGSFYTAMYNHLVNDYNGSVVYNKAKFVKEIDPTYNYWHAMCYGAGKFVALTQDGYVTTSTDGITWTTPTQNTNLGSNYWWGLVYVNGTFYALGAYGRKSTSTDGVTWTANETDSNFSGKGYFYSLIWDGSYFRAISETGYIGTSSDWTNWTFTRPDELAMAGFATRCFGLAYNGSVYVVSLDNNKISTSSDFVNWTERTQVFNGSAVSRLCYDGEKFVAVRCPVSGDFTGWQVCVSFDGINWSEARSIDGRDNMASDSSNDAAICKTTDGQYAILTFGGNFCVSDTYETETIGGTTIEFITTADGHKIVRPNQETAVVSIYNTVGIAWYYILDTVNQRFKLPRTKFGFTGMRDGAGKYVAPGAPNITGNTHWIGAVFNNNNQSYANGVFSAFDANNGAYAGGGGYTNAAARLSFDASRSSSVYGNSNTIQPPATQMYLYFYAGNYTPNAVAQTAGLNAELFNDKLDINMNNVSASAATNMNAVGIRTVVETYASGTDWYRRYSDGWVEQGCDGHNRGSSNRWNFLIGMAGTYNAQITARGSQRYAWVTDMGSTYLTFNAADDSSANNDGLYYIKVCGYAAS